MTQQSLPRSFAQTVLVLEDEVLIAMDLEDTLTSLGCPEVRCARTVDAARQAILESRPDVALLDVHLAAGETSFQLAAELRARNVPFLFLSGSQGDEVPASLGGAGFISKPFTPEDLARALAEALQRIAA